MHVTLHLTGRCNLRCSYCYAAPHQGGDMTQGTAVAAVRLAMDLTDRERPGAPVGVIFFGGEPLLCRDLIRGTVERCLELGAASGRTFHFKVTTNGIGLDEAFLDDPITGRVLVALSHDGVRASHDAHRLDAAGRPTFDALEPVIDLLLARRPHSPVMMVVTPGTVARFADSVQYLSGRGFRYIIASLDYGSPWDPARLRRLDREYRKLADWYFRETMRESKFYFSPFEVKIASHVFPGSCLANRCELGRRQISVAPSGRLYPCVQFVGDGTGEAMSIGTVASGIDEAARARLYEANAAGKEECSACAIRERCNHHCGCLNVQATGSVTRVSPVLCAHERTVLPIADGLAARLFAARSALFVQKHYNEMFPLVSMIEDSSR